MKKWSDPEVMDEVRDFYRGLNERSADAFDAAVELLADRGPALGRPVVGEVSLEPDYRQHVPLFGRHLKELRPLGTNIRVLFTFGPDRVPVLLVAGDKVGEWNRWYPGAIERAARLYRELLAEGGR
jgi:hypothetical protein